MPPGPAIQRDPGAVQAVVRSFYAAMDHYLAHPDEFEQLIAPLVDRTIESCRRAVRDAKVRVASAAAVAGSPSQPSGRSYLPFNRHAASAMFFSVASCSRRL